MENKSEIDNLITLAENVSERVHVLHSVKINTRFKVYIFILLSYSLVMLTSFVILKGNQIKYLDVHYIQLAVVLFLLVATFLSIGLFLLYFFRMKEIFKSIEKEQEILKELLDLIFEYHDFISKENLSLVDQASTRIRLKRISFALD